MIQIASSSCFEKEQDVQLRKKDNLWYKSIIFVEPAGPMARCQWKQLATNPVSLEVVRS